MVAWDQSKWWNYITTKIVGHDFSDRLSLEFTEKNNFNLILTFFINHSCFWLYWLASQRQLWFVENSCSYSIKLFQAILVLFDVFLVYSISFQLFFNQNVLHLCKFSSNYNHAKVLQEVCNSKNWVHIGCNFFVYVVCNEKF